MACCVDKEDFMKYTRIWKEIMFPRAQWLFVVPIHSHGDV